MRKKKFGKYFHKNALSQNISVINSRKGTEQPRPALNAKIPFDNHVLWKFDGVENAMIMFYGS